ncbi:hypothetical protein A1O1_00144 [Capronia coronata CBS 617.96]|uniref:Catabolic 3-dehydroquinase n=1 Tax=Capronia coronata CBS 617.96 TaxID=1182541 RepID=W9Z0D6_9EURO|nr:uncharacterized protein A1O1_00144 [Capronia coronata CBS 617.96]EXJ95026.1 hypothetical protein A1O1_00144 [Capronia coronata CBS 617.96]
MSDTHTVSSSPSRKILLINGPNLNLLGTREPHIYGSTTLLQVVEQTIHRGKELGITVVPFQSNHEGAIVDFLHSHFVPVPAPVPVPATSAMSASTTTTAKTTTSDPATTARFKPEPALSPPKTAVIINPAAYTHTSVAIRDALLATSFPFIEVHISNVHAREAWRHHSYFSDKAVAVIVGLGTFGYQAALEFWAQKWEEEDARAS